jgi:gas vesicle protein
MTDLSNAIKKLTDAQKVKVFGNGTKWMNLEIMYPATANVVDYDVAEIVFHGTLEYDDSGRPIGQPKDSARMLAGMIKQVNGNVQKTFKIGKPNFLKVPKTQNFGKKKNLFLGKLKKIQNEYGLKDSNRLGEYHQAFWQEYVFNASKQFGIKLKANEFVQLVNRWAYFDKSYKVPMIKKDYADRPKFLDWILSTDKNDHTKIFKDNIQPIETLFFEVGAEILKNISGYMAVNPDKTVQSMKKEVESALKDLKSGGNPEKLKKLKLQIEKLEAIGGVNAIVPTEGVVFKYKGKVYKFTGAFAPINQILGSLKFG